MSEPQNHPISMLCVDALVLFAAFIFVQARACNQIHPYVDFSSYAHSHLPVYRSALAQIAQPA